MGTDLLMRMIKNEVSIVIINKLFIAIRIHVLAKTTAN